MNDSHKKPGGSKPTLTNSTLCICIVVLFSVCVVNFAMGCHFKDLILHLTVGTAILLIDLSITHQNHPDD